MLRPLRLVVSALGASLVVGSAAAGARANVIAVKQGESAAAALSRAEPGDTIRLQPGVFHDDLVIDRPGVTLEGELGAVVEEVGPVMRFR